MRFQVMILAASSTSVLGCYEVAVVGADADGDVDVDGDSDSDSDADADADEADAGAPQLEWTFEVVDQAADDGESVALAVDEQGNPHLHYMWSDNTGDELHHETRYATRRDGEWHIETLSEAPGMHMGSAIAVQPDGTVQIAWIRHDYEFPGPPAAYLSRSFGGNGRWVVEQIAGPAEFGSGIAMVLDAAGAMHIAYETLEDCAGGARLCVWLRHATDGGGGAWSIEDVDEGTVSATPGIAMDPAGEPRISYLAGEDLGEVRVARHDDAGWQVETAGEIWPDPDAQYVFSIARWGPMGLVVDGAGANHVFTPGGALGYFTDEDGAWRAEVVAESPGRGAYFPAAAMDGAGTLHSAWMVTGFGGDGRLHSDVDHASGRAGAWSVETVVDTQDIVDSDVAFAIDRQDRLHVVYVSADEMVVYGFRDGAAAP